MFRSRIHIPSPCQQSWEEMEAHPNGAFCQSCQKEVVDFTGMTDRQILDYLSKFVNLPCGRFSPSQLNRPLITNRRGFRKWIVSSILPAFLLGAGFSGDLLHAQQYPNPQIEMAASYEAAQTLSSQSFYIAGLVTNEKEQPIAGALVRIEGTEFATYSNEEGYFELQGPHSDSVQMLMVAFVGYELQYIPLKSLQKHLILNLATRPIALTYAVTGNFDYGPGIFRRFWWGVKRLFRRR